MLVGETILSGCASTCSDCGVRMVLQVCRSAAGHYLGTWCDCGPYSRESEYFKTREEAEKAIKADQLADWVRK